MVILRLHEKVLGLIALLNQFFDLVKIESNDYVIPLSKVSLMRFVGRMCWNFMICSYQKVFR